MLGRRPYTRSKDDIKQIGKRDPPRKELPFIDYPVRKIADVGGLVAENPKSYKVSAKRLAAQLYLSQVNPRYNNLGKTKKIKATSEFIRSRIPLAYIEEKKRFREQSKIYKDIIEKSKPQKLRQAEALIKLNRDNDPGYKTYVSNRIETRIFELRKKIATLRGIPFMRHERPPIQATVGDLSRVLMLNR